MDNQLLKRKLQGKIKNLQTINDGSPLTNLKLDKTIEKEIEKLTKELENLNPHPLPLLYTPYLLEGTWQLQYSTAREIRFLDSLPLGLKVGKVYQVINVGDKAFFNIAEVQDFLKLISGSVKVTASCEPAINTSGLADKRINVYFDQRYLSIEKILGIDTPQLNPFKVIKANNPQGRIPTLDTTYIDETLRIGRGGDEGLFILNKVNV